MNTSQGALYFGAGIDLNQWRRDIDSMRRDIVGLTRDVEKETRNVDSAFKNLSIGIAGYFSVNALKGFAMELINVRGEFQKTEIAFSTMLGSADKARVLMGQMVDLAAKTPFGLQEVSAGAKQLLAFQVPANQVVDVLTRMGNIAAGLGVPLSRINLVYGQVRAKGRLMGDDLRQFTEAGIPMVAELAKKFNKTTAEITDMVSAGKIGFKDVQEVLFAMTNEGGMFFNLMEKQSASLSGKVANLGDAWDTMLNKIGQSSEGVLYGAIESATYLVENYKEVAEILLELIAAYGIYKAAVIATSVISTNYNKTIASEIALLSISEKMKLGRAMVTQRQAEATARDTVSELANTRAKYSALQAEVSSLAIKKQQAIQSGITATAKAQEARVQLALARMELSSIQATGTARQIEIAQKRVQTAQNTVIATQETASIARKRTLAVATEFNTAKQQLENTAQAVGVATKNAATAAEAAQVAAKNANSIATTRLTILQNLQTIATQAGARAQAFLNATILANPYALAAVLLAAMTYAIYKQATALTALQEIQQKFKEELSQTNVGVNEQTAKLNSLIAVIKKQTTSYDEAKKILAQVNALTNNRIEGLTVEAIKTGQADAAIKAYTKSLYRQAEVMLKVQEIAKLQEELKALDLDLKEETFKEKFDFTFNIFSDNYSHELGFQGAKEERKKAIVKTIADYKKDVEKAVKDGLDLSGTTVEAEPPKVKLGILEGLNEELKATNEAIQKAGSDAEIKRLVKVRDRIQAKIDSYGLKKKKTKEDRQLAEILPIGSIKELQRRANLIQEAIDTAVNGQIKLRKLDKFGNDKDKEGNPLLTGEIISSEEAAKRLNEINEEIRRKQIKSFDEDLSETERQWKAKYQIAEFYGQKIANEQFPELKGSYYDDISKRFEQLNNKRNEGVSLSNSEISQWQKLKDILSSLTGEKDPLSNFNDSMDKALQKLPSLYDQIEYLQNLRDSQDNKGTSLGFFAAADSKLQEKIQEQRNIYQEFLNEQRTFEQKKAEVEQKYNDIRKRIGENQALTDAERLRQLNASYKAEGKEITDINLEGIQKTDLWIKAFGDLERQGISSLKNLKKSLQLLLESGKITDPEGIKVIQDQILKIEETIGKRNPFAALMIAVEKYRKKRQELSDAEKKYGKDSDQYKAKLKELGGSFVELVELSGAAANAMIEIVVQVGDAFGGLSDDLKQTLAEVQQLVDGIVNTVAGYFSGNYGQMISGIVQIVGAMVKLLSGDKGRERDIKKWQNAVDELKTSYNELQYAIEKTAGEASLSMNRGLIENLEEQKRLLTQMRDEESKKKKSDAGKIASLNDQISQVNQQINDVIDNFKKQIVSTDFKELSQSLADALINAFGQGENAAEAFDKVVDDVMRNAVANALKIKFLDKAAEDIVNSIYSSMGFGNGATNFNDGKIKEAQDKIAELEKQIKQKESQTYSPYLAQEVLDLKKKRQELLDLIGKLKAEMASVPAGGSFDGLSQEERDKIKAQGENAMNQYMAALQQYQDLFGNAAENAQGIKGDVKGITEKTAGALESQFNAMRINLVAALQYAKQNHIVNNAQTALLSQIEVNTRRLHSMDKTLTEMNAKMKKSLAGVP